MGASLTVASGGIASEANLTAKWTNSPLSDPDFFPIAVWLQSPANAGRYQQAGINTYVGLWKGPTGEQLSALQQAGLYVICDQNKVALQHLHDPTIIAWMHDDEPDNAQSLGEGRGWGPPIPPAKIVEDYHRMRAADPSRPVLLNLGQGVAWDNWFGRGARSNHPEDYPEYLKGCDIASFRANSTNVAVPIATMVKRHEGATYLFAVAMRNGETSATFKLTGISGERTVEVIGENRTLLATDGNFTDCFRSWEVHLYRMPAASKR